MSLQRQVPFWIAALVLLAALLWLLSDILLPFVAGMALAYLFDPPVRRLQQMGLNRTAAAAGVVLMVVVVLLALVLLLAPVLGNQLSSLFTNLPGYARKIQEIIADPEQTRIGRVIGPYLPDLSTSLGEMMQQGSGLIATFLTSLWTGGRVIVSAISLLVVTPVVAIYLLLDWDRMVASIDSWVPRHRRETVRMLARDMDSAISAFMRGQALVCLILSVFYVLCLAWIGLNFSLLIGIAAGFLSFIPFVGAILGLLVAGGVAVGQFWPDIFSIVLVIGVFLLGQAIEGNILQPYLVGKSVGLHPVWLMFALLAFGYLFGFVGLLVAVPVAAAIGVLARFALTQYLESPLYTGEDQR